MVALITRYIPALVSLALVCVSVTVFRADLRTREPLEQFVRQFQFDVRRPDVAESVALTPSFDVGADLIGDYAVADAIVPVKLRDVTAEARQAWIEMPGTIGEELDSARELMLDSIASRPGWPYHQSILGQIVYTNAARVLSPDIVRRSDLWSRPLQSAARAASADGRLWQTLALGYLQTWPDLSAKHERVGPEAFRRAFEDPIFMREAFGPALDILGTERAVAALPDRAVSLKHAFTTLAKRGQVDYAWTVYKRWESREWSEREADLKTIEFHVQRGDTDIVRGLCEKWASAHSVWDWDSKAGQRQVARLLQAWPAGKVGTWQQDPRGDAIRYFLSDRYLSAPAAGIARAVDSLTNVPLTVHAQTLIVAGDVWRAESLDRTAADESYFARVPYLVQLARHELDHGTPERAAAVVARIPDAAREECAVRALREEIARHQTRPAAHAEPIPVVMAIGSERILCNDNASPLEIRVTSDLRGIVEIRRNGARVTTVLTSPGQALSVKTANGAGTQFINVRSHVQVPRAVTRATSSTGRTQPAESLL
jgi:hypothetical protein